jgi:hypothetical protein
MPVADMVFLTVATSLLRSAKIIRFIPTPKRSVRPRLFLGQARPHDLWNARVDSEEGAPVGHLFNSDASACVALCWPCQQQGFVPVTEGDVRAIQDRVFHRF